MPPTDSAAVTPSMTASRALRLLRRGVALVFHAHSRAALVLFALTLASGSLPAAIAWVGKNIVDQAVVHAFAPPPVMVEPVLWWVALELVLVVLSQAVDRGAWLNDSLLRTSLGQYVNERILEKTLSLPLPDVEDAETYDLLSRARRGASHRPLSLVLGVFALTRNALVLTGYGVLLWQLAPWALGLVAIAAGPAFMAESRFSTDAFRAFRWRAPETRRQNYFEALIARQDHAKEVRLFGLGPLFLERYREIFRAHYTEDRDLTVKRAVWGYLLGLVALGAFYGCYAWIALQTVRGELTFGDMAMYLMVFRGAQRAMGALLGRLREGYDDLLYVGELFAFLDLEPTSEPRGVAVRGPAPEDGLRFEGVEFRYPGADSSVLSGVDLHLPPGHALALVGENGAGKTTLIKLMSGLYRPTRGRILLEGRPLDEWDVDVLRRRIGVIFQDFVRYQLTVGENIGVGDVAAIESEERWEVAAHKGLADTFVGELPEGYRTQLGRWFARGRELSGGQWQKIALSRAFMRADADILVLDEPTAAMDAEAETRIFDRFRSLMAGRMAILISHRFGTVRMADTIAVLHEGQIAELGTHDELLARGGRYARLFKMQARGYR